MSLIDVSDLGSCVSYLKLLRYDRSRVYPWVGFPS